MAWAIGARCQAYSTLDGNWYTARVSGVSAAGHFVVQLEQDSSEEEVRGVERLCLLGLTISWLQQRSCTQPAVSFCSRVWQLNLRKTQTLTVSKADLWGF